MLLVCFCSYSNANETQPATVAPAQSETSPNLIDNNNWNGATYGADPGGCCSSISGGGALYDTTTNTIMFGYGRDVLAQTIAINEALKLSGVEVDGYNYGWTWRTISNNGRGKDTLQFEVTVKDAAGNEVERYVYDYSSANHAMDVWHTESGTETFKQSYLDPQSIALSIIGQDGGFWAGYYGPEVKDVSLTLNYRANPCASNPLYDPSCEGYADAYAQQEYEQQCQANPLYDIGCNGYQQAYYEQQCNANPLYDMGCVGYEQAYFDQQCSIDGLWNSSCSGYEQAYFDQQCSLNPFYDTSCSGYAEAFYDQQCSINPLYDSGCNGYAEAYYDQQCSINPLYDMGCVGYETAYYNQQCSINPLYDIGCNGYEDAYYNQQCSINPLYDNQCAGYATAYYNQQCSLDALYDSGCGGYEEAYYNKYILPAQKKLESEVAGGDSTDPTSMASKEDFTVSDPVESIKNVNVTGDAQVDQILRETTNVPTTNTLPQEPIRMPEVVVERQVEEPQEESRQEDQMEEELVALVEREDRDEKSERDSESSGDVGESVDSDGDKESSDSGKEGEGSSNDESGGDSESRESGGDAPTEVEKKESKSKKLKEIAAKRASQLANQMSEAATLEAQQAVQLQVLRLIGFNPDFSAYRDVSLTEPSFYADEQLPDAKIPNSRRGLRNGLAQQILHEKMVDMQYK